jgi:methionine sulfoxide reductase heme-binding subunit
VPTRTRWRLAHFVALAGATALAGAVLHATWPRSEPTTQELSLLFAGVSFVTLAIALAVGPARVLRGRPNPRSNDLRRDVALWSALTAGLHVVFALQHHLGGSIPKYFFEDGTVAVGAIATTAFGLSNWIGLGALLLVAVLAATSNDVSVRALGGRWKTLHRTTYVLAGLVLVHTALFWHVEDRAWAIRVSAAALVIAVVILQGLGVRATRRDRSSTAPFGNVT